MVKEFDLKNMNFQTFYVSSDASRNPLISKFLELVSKFKKFGILEKTREVLISFSYGKRVLINSNKNKINELKNEDFIEIVDYDPVKNNMLLIGKKQPCVETPVHWMIHHARNDVNIIVQLYDNILSDKLSKKHPLIRDDYPISSIEMIKEILKNLRTSNIVILKNESVMFCGQHPDEVEKMILSAYEVQI